MKKLGKYAIIIISIIIGLIIIAGIIHTMPVQNIKDSFKNTTSTSLLKFIGISITMMLLFTWRWHAIITSTEKVSFWKLFPYKIVGYGISFITPIAKLGGEPLRAMLLQREGIDFKKGFTTVVIDKLIDLTSSSFLFVLGIIVAISSFALPKNTYIILIIISIIVLFAIGWFYFRMISSANIILSIFKFFKLDKIKFLKKIEKDIVEMDEVLITFYKKHKSNFTKAMIISMVAWILMFLEFKFALEIVGIYDVSFGGLFIIIGMIGATYLIPVPLALGVSEAGEMSVFSLLKLSSAAGFALAMIIRIRDFMWTLIGIGFLVLFGINIKQAYDKSVQKNKDLIENNFIKSKK